MEYTLGVTGVELLLDWSTERQLEGGWQEVEVCDFSIILAICTCLRTSRGKGFMTVQIPLTSEPAESVSNLLREKIIASEPRKTLFASYAGVEQVVAMSDQVEWTMATMSNAGGAIPLWIQRS
ncbi:hypothetical protein BDV23DRAFT_169199 [Aspergillus alliaceus]|uniref:Uncharacterized protein n=1 Tax=Petromyces alliaceus TaxID=209559 RepID=A0A5N6FSW3_PETAA|nr:uncharacterized protein BDW43DRAFT_300895 [Aspergillus alliaceus]KAB8232539.1 hypothetical protein BDW43DRAFT_300895 [Aspergillus alliaceus]KAE8394794.1 hypothetical protein BDV23DRAFT_169199 [Aspergillus alliaceus]